MDLYVQDVSIFSKFMFESHKTYERKGSSMA
jgi:hypothetical protein